MRLQQCTDTALCPFEEIFGATQVHYEICAVSPRELILHTTDDVTSLVHACPPLPSAVTM